MYKKYTIAVLLGVLLLLLLLIPGTAPVNAQTTNLILNGGMENHNPWFANWTAFGDPVQQDERAVVHSGSYSAKYSRGNGGHFQTVNVAQGARYNVSGWSYRFYTKSADLVGIQFGSGNIDWYALFTYPGHGIKEWYNFSINVQATSSTMTVYLEGTNNPDDTTITPNDVYFDDIDISQINTPPTASVSSAGNTLSGYANVTGFTFSAPAQDIDNNLTNVKILSSADQGSTWELISECGTPGAGSYTCTHPNPKIFTQAGTYRIVVNASDAEGGACSGNPFLTYPYTSGSTVYISCGLSSGLTVTISNPVPTLGSLKISADIAANPPGVTAGTYGISGLRADDPNMPTGKSGGNYYNSLTIQQNVTNGTSTNVALAGVAFTSKAYPPSSNSLYELTRSAFADNGFVLLYANQPKTANYYTATGGTASQSFDSKSFYVYFQGTWSARGYQPTIDDFENRRDSNNKQALLVYMTSAPAFSTTDPGPTFHTTLYLPLGSHTWGTYGYVMENNASSTETSSSLDPSP